MQSCEKRLCKSASGLRMIPVSNSSASPFELTEPIWVSDKEVVFCQSCQIKFDFFKRKHHCRRCGKCFCDQCSHYLISLQRMYFVDPVRHCYECAIYSKTECDFFDSSLKILIKGANLNVSPCITDSGTSEVTCRCYFSNDCRYLHLKPLKEEAANQESFPLKIILLKVTAADFRDKSTIISFKDTESSLIKEIKLISNENCQEWFNFLKQALKMMDIDTNQT